MADYRPLRVSDEKIKKSCSNDDLNLPLERTTDILAIWGQPEAGAVPLRLLHGDGEDAGQLPGEAVKKKVDMIAANSLRQAGAASAQRPMS